ncbi:GNAT family N-acetyltransferase [Clostridium sp. CX1]|uniref:GNAT family protein n=1 Tax=Clostridium tanneri TaxID=3037988 RepID=A0ABU4JXR3_9CLOT|nr:MULTISPECIES: GNAT family protein [unclassified Clostridium]MCT8978749.1 GNAT family N-acetyltransferase [Clostridium sp. CX1]MDW8802952.1 GNAT family protein [Clostridium sp. A1-XYC3]
MGKQQGVTVDLVKGSTNEYIIRDNAGITIGRVFVVELSRENRYCNFRIKFYKDAETSYELLKDALNIFLTTLFRNMDINKVNVITDDEINIMSFTDLGFKLEGILSNSMISNKMYRDELLFGLDFQTFRNEHKYKELEISGIEVDLAVLTPEDVEDVLRYYLKNKEYLMPYEPDRDDSFYTLSAQKRILIEGYKQYLNGDSVNFGIYKRKKLIGKIQISNIVMGVFKSAFIGYSIDEDEQGKGHMKEALKLVVKYAFDEMGLHRLEASTLVDNVKSQKVLRACGFKELGINESYLFINSKWRDHITFYKVR